LPEASGQKPDINGMMITYPMMKKGIGEAV
jgi:hypothetical protein